MLFERVNYDHYKKIRQIKGMRKSWISQYFKQYLFSGTFIYSLIFASLHFFLDSDKNGLFVRTYGLIIMDAVANVLYLILYIFQSEKDMINDYLKNKKQQVDLKTPLLDKKIGKNGTVSAFKIMIFLLFSILYVFYLYSYKYFINVDMFMTKKSAFEYVMFFISIAYFEVFWEDGVKNFSCNLKNLKGITKNDSSVRKTTFYLFLFLVALYQIYSFISELSYGISLL